MVLRGPHWQALLHDPSLRLYQEGFVRGFPGRQQHSVLSKRVVDAIVAARPLMLDVADCHLPAEGLRELVLWQSPPRPRDCSIAVRCCTVDPCLLGPKLPLRVREMGARGACMPPAVRP